MTRIDSLILDALHHHLLDTTIHHNSPDHSWFIHTLSPSQRIPNTNPRHMVYYSLSTLHTNLNYRYVLINTSHPIIVREYYFHSNLMTAHTLPHPVVYIIIGLIFVIIFTISFPITQQLYPYTSHLVYISLYLYFTSQHHITSRTFYVLHLD